MTYQFHAVRPNGKWQRFSQEEQVSKTFYTQIRAGDTLMVVYAYTPVLRAQISGNDVVLTTEDEAFPIFSFEGMVELIGMAILTLGSGVLMVWKVGIFGRQMFVFIRSVLSKPR